MPIEKRSPRPLDWHDECYFSFSLLPSIIDDVYDSLFLLLAHTGNARSPCSSDYRKSPSPKRYFCVRKSSEFTRWRVCRLWSSCSLRCGCKKSSARQRNIGSQTQESEEQHRTACRDRSKCTFIKAPSYSSQVLSKKQQNNPFDILFIEKKSAHSWFVLLLITGRFKWRGNLLCDSSKPSISIVLLHARFFKAEESRCLMNKKRHRSSEVFERVYWKWQWWVPLRKVGKLFLFESLERFCRE